MQCALRCRRYQAHRSSLGSAATTSCASRRRAESACQLGCGAVLQTGRAAAAVVLGKAPTMPRSSLQAQTSHPARGQSGLELRARRRLGAMKAGSCVQDACTSCCLLLAPQLLRSCRLLRRLALRRQLLAGVLVPRPPVGFLAGRAAEPHRAAGTADGWGRAGASRSARVQWAAQRQHRPRHPAPPSPAGCPGPAPPPARRRSPHWSNAGRRSCGSPPPWPPPAACWPPLLGAAAAALQVLLPAAAAAAAPPCAQTASLQAPA